MKIGDTLYHFDQNRREYAKPPAGSGRIYGNPIYSGHFSPMVIKGENRRSWLFDFGMKADKANPRKHNFFTAEQMADDIWIHEHRYELVRRVQDSRDAAALREIAKIVGYEWVTK